MAEISVVPGEVDISLLARAKAGILLPQIMEAPGGLYPLTSSAWEMDEYRMFNGWPASVPPCDIRADTLVSCVGEVLAQREDPTDVTTAADLRWVADSEYYSVDTLEWWPIQGGISWVTDAPNAPVMVNNYEYRVGRERFYVDALNFDSDTDNFMEADFTSIMAGTGGYTVIMVLSLNSVYGNAALPYNGLWCPCEPEANWVSVTTQGNYLYLQSDNTPRTRSLSIAHMVSTTAPSYLAMVIDRPTTTLYAGTGPQNIQRKATHVGDPEYAPNFDVNLGRAEEDPLHTADMALLDIGIYARPLTAIEVKSEFALLSRSYGGDK